MESRIANALKLKHQPVAILWTDQKPEGAGQFQPGKWGCVMAAFGATAERGRVAAFDNQTFGCWGGGTGLGFGNAYEQFPGGADCFCGFLSNGNDRTEKGRAVFQQCSSWLTGHMGEDFRRGEGYRKSPELVDQWIKGSPLMQVPSKYVVFAPLHAVTPEQLSQLQVVVFLANPDQVSALVVLANYGRGDADNAIIPFGAGCQTIGIFAYKEGRSAKPRAVVGLVDLSARKYLRRLGKDLMTVALPLSLFQEMEENVEGSFLQKHSWSDLRDSEQ